MLFQTFKKLKFKKVQTEIFVMPWAENTDCNVNIQNYKQQKCKIVPKQLAIACHLATTLASH